MLANIAKVVHVRSAKRYRARMRASERPRSWIWLVDLAVRRSNHTLTEREVQRSFVEAERRWSAVSSLSRVIAARWSILRNCYFSKSVLFERTFIRGFIDRILIGLFQGIRSISVRVTWSRALVIKRQGWRRFCCSSALSRWLSSPVSWMILLLYTLILIRFCNFWH